VRLPQRPTDVGRRPLAAEADERWRFVQKKANKPWLWIALEAQTRQVMALHVGDWRRESAQELGAKLPLVYRDQAPGHTEQ
jgi:insertion element IS1 protein InsB